MPVFQGTSSDEESAPAAAKRIYVNVSYRRNRYVQGGAGRFRPALIDRYNSVILSEQGGAGRSGLHLTTL